MIDSARASGPVVYSERLWFGPMGWFTVVGLAAVAAAALYPVSPTAAVVAALLALGGGAMAASAAATTVRVADGELRAGPAHIPLHLLDRPRPLDAAATREALGPGLDARAYVCLRAWARTAVRVDVVDPQDPTPYWLVSTRHPQALVEAIRSAG